MSPVSIPVSSFLFHYSGVRVGLTNYNIGILCCFFNDIEGVEVAFDNCDGWIFVGKCFGWRSQECCHLNLWVFLNDLVQDAATNVTRRASALASGQLPVSLERNLSSSSYMNNLIFPIAAY
jgi:hypothetical protein